MAFPESMVKGLWPDDIVKGFWTPAWAVQLDLKLNQLHAETEIIMAQNEEMRAAWNSVRTEVAEAVAKFNELEAKLEAALEDDADTEALKQTVTEVSAEMKATSEHLDTAFKTQFHASGN